VSRKILEKNILKFGHFSGKHHVKFGNFVNFRANIIKILVYG